MKTKNWSYIVMALYVVLNMSLVLGTVWVLFFEQRNEFRMVDYLGLGFVVAAIMFLCQYVLFDLKVEAIETRPVARRKIGLASVCIALLMAFITYFLFFTLVFVVFGEGKANPLNRVEWLFGFLLIFIFVASWVFWGIVFARMGRNKEDEANKFIRESMAVLIKGSVVELLVAIPSHLIMRHREDCCAPVFSFMGIITGLTVMFFAFGPGILFLYHQRMKAKRARISEKAGIID